MGFGEAVALLGGIMVFCVILIAYYVLYAIGAWKINVKAGEAGWKAFIPVYNTFIIYKISWKTVMFWIFLAAAIIMNFCGGQDATGMTAAIGKVASLVAVVMSVIQNYKLSKSFGHGVGYAIGLIFLNPIFLMILGIGSSQYQGPQN